MWFENIIVFFYLRDYCEKSYYLSSYFLTPWPKEIPGDFSTEQYTVSVLSEMVAAGGKKTQRPEKENNQNQAQLPERLWGVNTSQISKKQISQNPPERWGFVWLNLMEGFSG